MIIAELNTNGTEISFSLMRNLSYELIFNVFIFFKLNYFSVYFAFIIFLGPVPNKREYYEKHLPKSGFNC